ncbi:hypothetical protein C1X72_17765 [Pseudomonas sp. FW306-2-2C-D06B]|nr:hypothetical protein C1X72_17765 [Pseudomonas sp. FW306-2-2C-D06B]PNA98415.1 hypothetical protein C1X74_11580 [Pseudomonas sp. GW460-5]PNB58873.1 hypothetical protein C1X73_12670 [Pseudomonas sp. FW305-130]POA73631.1 hypothetical protein C1890_27060 [Pseudomonas sp. DP16D-R1]
MSWEASVYEVHIDAESCVIQCEILDVIEAEPNPGIWTSDWDAQGYRELEFRVVSGVAYDTEGHPSDLGRNGCAELVDRYAEFIEDELWMQLDAERGG